MCQRMKSSSFSEYFRVFVQISFSLLCESQYNHIQLGEQHCCNSGLHILRCKRVRQDTILSIAHCICQHYEGLNGKVHSYTVFYRYFSQQAAKKKDQQSQDLDSDAESVNDEEFDDFLGNVHIVSQIVTVYKEKSNMCLVAIYKFRIVFSQIFLYTYKCIYEILAPAGFQQLICWFIYMFCTSKQKSYKYNTYITTFFQIKF